MDVMFEGIGTILKNRTLHSSNDLTLRTQYSAVDIEFRGDRGL